MSMKLLAAINIAVSCVALVLIIVCFEKTPSNQNQQFEINFPPNKFVWTDSPDVTPEAWVCNGIYEIDGYIVDEANFKCFWVFKNNLQAFKKKHPDMDIVGVEPSVYFSNEWKGIPYKYFVFTKEKTVTAEVTSIPSEMK